ncbi:MAG: hypothetical protein GX996_06025 [Firmicutes bacterium]|nr:hypothetical protein [Bacillota bacterium]
MIISKMKLKKILLLLFLAFLLAIGENVIFKERVPLGIYLEQKHIGGKTYQELAVILEEKENDIKNKEIHFFIPGENVPRIFTLKESGIQLHKNRIMEETIGLNYPLNYKKKIMFFCKHPKIPLYFTADREIFASVLRSIGHNKCRQPQNALIWAEKGKLKLKPHSKGIKLELEQVLSKIIAELEGSLFIPSAMQIKLEDEGPEITISQIMDKGISGEIATASTYFDSKAANRTHNIALASEKLDNTLLAPNKIFSFNQTVGEAGLQEGFKEAPVIVNDRVVMGPGGGICQVSSTLYNAALKAGLSIEERHNHGLPVGYIAPGYDATVAYNYKDLKFRNDTSFYILIHLQVLNNELKVTIFGDPSKAKRVEIVTKSLQKIEPPVHYRELKEQPFSYSELIQKGTPGYTAETVRIFYDKEKEVSRESLGKSYYAPIPEIYAVGVLQEGEQDR